jgi:hypothetical protein
MTRGARPQPDLRHLVFPQLEILPTTVMPAPMQDISAESDSAKFAGVNLATAAQAVKVRPFRASCARLCQTYDPPLPSYTS